MNLKGAENIKNKYFQYKRHSILRQMILVETCFNELREIEKSRLTL